MVKARTAKVINPNLYRILSLYTIWQSTTTHKFSVLIKLSLRLTVKNESHVNARCTQWETISEERRTANSDHQRTTLKPNIGRIHNLIKLPRVALVGLNSYAITSLYMYVSPDVRPAWPGSQMIREVSGGGGGVRLSIHGLW